VVRGREVVTASGWPNRLGRLTEGLRGRGKDQHGAANDLRKKSYIIHLRGEQRECEPGGDDVEADIPYRSRLLGND